MTANKNEPDKKPASSASAQASARPHATLDLKATEVTPPLPSRSPARPSQPSPKLPRHPPRPRPLRAAPPPLPRRAPVAPRPDRHPRRDPPPGAQRRKTRPARRRPVPPRPAPRGYGGFFTHVAAGLAGGIVALLAADMLAQQLGFGPTDRPEQVTALEQRLAALEASQRQRTIAARSRQSPRRRRSQARQARAARRQHRRHRQKAGRARRGPQRDQGQGRRR